MPQAASITLTDATPVTPVDYVYEPIRTEPDLLLVNGDSVTSAGNKNLSVSFSKWSANRATDKVGLHFLWPIENTVDGVTSILSTPRFDGVWTLPNTMTDQQLLDFGAELRDALQESLIKSYYESKKPAY